MTRRADFLLAAAAALSLLATVGNRTAGAHKPITSKYTYNEHVYPIVRQKCGACHVEGGIAPMSLLTFQEARPWAESLRNELTAERMPPWQVDQRASAPILTPRAGSSLTPKELDTIIVWVTGGTPEGDPSRHPGPAAISNTWRAGMPDATITMPEAANISAEQQEDTREFVLATGFTTTRFIKGADLLPGNPTLVHDATIAIENGPELAAWTPGDDPTMTTDVRRGAAYRLDRGRRLVLRIHYKKSWRHEHMALSDRSSIGLYFTDPPADGHEIAQLQVRAAAGSSQTNLTTAASLIAIRPIVSRAQTTIAVDARLPSGEQVHLIRLRNVDPGWPKRYWLARPFPLPAGSLLSIAAQPATSGSNASDLRAAMDVISDP